TADSRPCAASPWDSTTSNTTANEASSTPEESKTSLHTKKGRAPYISRRRLICAEHIAPTTRPGELQACVWKRWTLTPAAVRRCTTIYSPEHGCNQGSLVPLPYLSDCAAVGLIIKPCANSLSFELSGVDSVMDYMILSQFLQPQALNPAIHNASFPRNQAVLHKFAKTNIHHMNTCRVHFRAQSFTQSKNTPYNSSPFS
ncbi:hypothetical protein PG2006B_1738, partial [Bifidobacterium animalis subsp. animalis]